MNTIITQKLKSLPITPGVYIYRNNLNRVIYVGKAVNLKNRVSSYFQKGTQDAKTTELVRNIANLEWIEVESEFEALILEMDLIKRYKPKYNIRFRDDKNYSYLKVTKEDYPRVSVVRQTGEEAQYVGPFTDATALRTILKTARYIYPYCSCDKKGDDVCLFYHLKLCPGHSPKHISVRDYQKNINGLIKLFQGKTKKIEAELKKSMTLASAEKKFELAAEIRDKLRYAKKISQMHLFSDRELSGDAGLRQLTEELSLSAPPKRIECYDISNIMGTAAVGSMVVFRNGIASPKDYRRFQIKTVKGADDFAMMAEVLRRRFSHVGTRGRSDLPEGQTFRKVKWEIPDLIILDGGKGQLSTILKLGVVPESVRVVSLAKRLEEIVTHTGADFEIINLPEKGEALFLVQRIRDEAHRFAVSYHRKVKSREMYETSLDGIPGIGPKTKKKLIGQFGSIKKIKAASLTELGRVVPLIIAKRIKEML